MAITFEIIFSNGVCLRHSSRWCVPITFFVRRAHRVVIGAPGITP
jgi:hypothetical protein